MSSRLELEKQLKEHDKLDKWWDSLDMVEKNIVHDNAQAFLSGLSIAETVTRTKLKPKVRPPVIATPVHPVADPFPMEAGSEKWPFKEEP